MKRFLIIFFLLIPVSVQLTACGENEGVLVGKKNDPQRQPDEPQQEKPSRHGKRQEKIGPCELSSGGGVFKVSCDRPIDFYETQHTKVSTNPMVAKLRAMMPAFRLQNQAPLWITHIDDKSIEGRLADNEAEFDVIILTVFHKDASRTHITL